MITRAPAFGVDALPARAGPRALGDEVGLALLVVARRLGLRHQQRALAAAAPSAAGPPAARAAAGGEGEAEADGCGQGKYWRARNHVPGSPPSSSGGLARRDGSTSGLDQQGLVRSDVWRATYGWTGMAREHDSNEPGGCLAI